MSVSLLWNRPTLRWVEIDVNLQRETDSFEVLRYAVQNTCII